MIWVTHLCENGFLLKALGRSLTPLVKKSTTSKVNALKKDSRMRSLCVTCFSILFLVVLERIRQKELLREHVDIVLIQSKTEELFSLPEEHCDFFPLI